MGDHEPESVQDRTRRHRAQAQVRDQKPAPQARELKQEGQFQVRAWKTRHAALELIPGAAAASIPVARADRTMASHATSSDLAAAVDRAARGRVRAPAARGRGR